MIAVSSRPGFGPISSCSIQSRSRTRPTFSAPKQLSVGMQWVLVNGVPVIADGVFNQCAARPGAAWARLPADALI